MLETYHHRVNSGLVEDTEPTTAATITVTHVRMIYRAQSFHQLHCNEKASQYIRKFSVFLSIRPLGC